MAILPVVKRFIVEDFAGIKEIPDFCTKLFYPLNLFLNATYSALANGLTLNANTLGLVKQATNITADSAGTASTTINWPYPQTPPQGVVVQSCTASSAPATYPLISWAYRSGVVTVWMQFVKVSSGAIVIDAGTKYNLTFWVNGG